MRFVKLIIGLVIAATAVVLLGRVMVNLVGDQPLITGLAEEPRGGCPSTDNCVSSLATSAPWAIAHLACPLDPRYAEQAFLDAVSTLERVEHTDAGAFVVQSRWMHFPDDVRYQLSERGLEVISSSRLGAGDLGANRRRVEHIAATMAADPACT